MNVVLRFFPVLAFVALHSASGWGQQITGTPGSPSATVTIDGAQLPPPPPKFEGKIEFDVTKSTPYWPPRVAPPKGAPNVLLIMTDDVGFGASSTFGGPVPTPALDRLARSGVRFANFHTTAMCSPTRAALLTGRNPHTLGAGAITDVASGYPGYSSVFPRNATTIARILRDNGYSTAHFGKHHNIPTWENNLSGSFNQWPNGLGFDYSYGFMIGSTDQWHPRLFRNNVSIDEPLAKGEILDAALSQDAMRWVHQQRSNAPDKPYFLYLAPGTAHAPHQPPIEWISRIKGQFDQGWERLREETFRRQKR
jgi:arylsulfatase A-like enzyme